MHNRWNVSRQYTDDASGQELHITLFRNGIAVSTVTSGWPMFDAMTTLVQQANLVDAVLKVFKQMSLGSGVTEQIKTWEEAIASAPFTEDKEKENAD